LARTRRLDYPNGGKLVRRPADPGDFGFAVVRLRQEPRKWAHPCAARLSTPPREGGESLSRATSSRWGELSNRDGGPIASHARIRRDATPMWLYLLNGPRVGLLSPLSSSLTTARGIRERSPTTRLRRAQTTGPGEALVSIPSQVRKNLVYAPLARSGSCSRSRNNRGPAPLRERGGPRPDAAFAPGRRTTTIFHVRIACPTGQITPHGCVDDSRCGVVNKGVSPDAADPTRQRRAKVPMGQGGWLSPGLTAARHRGRMNARKNASLPPGASMRSTASFGPTITMRGLASGKRGEHEVRRKVSQPRAAALEGTQDAGWWDASEGETRCSSPTSDRAFRTCVNLGVSRRTKR